MDLLPTFAALVGARLPQDRKIDGRNIWPLLTDPDAKSPHKAFFYYLETQLEAVRSGKWKLILPHKHRDKPVPMALYDLENDIGEQTDVSAQHPQVVKRLTALADEMRKELGDTVVPTAGTGVRPAGKV